MAAGAHQLHRPRLDLHRAAPVSEEFALSPQATGRILSSLFWTYALAQLPGGWLIDRIGPRKAVAWSAVLWGGFQALAGAATGSLFLLLTRRGGAAEAPMFPAGAKLNASWLPAHERARGATYGIGSSMIDFPRPLAAGALDTGDAAELTAYAMIAGGHYRGPVVDAHQHFWDPTRNRHPWLEPGAVIPFRYGDYTEIKRPYLSPDYRRDIGGYDVRKTVYVETEWDPRDPIGETRYASELAFGQPRGKDVDEVIRNQAAFPLVRGRLCTARRARAELRPADPVVEPRRRLPAR